MFVHDASMRFLKTKLVLSFTAPAFGLFGNAIIFGTNLSVGSVFSILGVSFFCVSAVCFGVDQTSIHNRVKKRSYLPDAISKSCADALSEKSQL